MAGGIGETTEKLHRVKVYHSLPRSRRRLQLQLDDVILEGSVPTPNGPAPLQVELNASTTTMVAIAPDYLDLSDGCTTTRRTLRVANVGPATRRVEALRGAPRIPGLAASPSSFEPPSESFAEIPIEGRVSGPFASTLTIELDDGTTLAASVFSHGRREKVHEHITLGRDERDMFWIFDDSGSMSDEQRLIAEVCVPVGPDGKPRKNVNSVTADDPVVCHTESRNP